MPYRPKYPFNALSDNGTSTIIGPDQIFADDHPYVIRYPDLMIDIASLVIPNPGQPARAVEQATAAPGEERRGPGRPRKEIADL